MIVFNGAVMTNRGEFVIVPPWGPEFEGAESHRQMVEFLRGSHPEFDFVVTLDSNERREHFFVHPPKNESEEHVYEVVGNLIIVASCILKGQFKELGVQIGSPKVRTFH